jgi:hypothetical protein
MVMHYKGKPVDTTNVQITVPALPTLTVPGAAPAAGGLPKIGAPSIGGAPAPAPAPAPGGLPKLGAPVVNP